MNRENFEQHVKFSDTPLDPREIATEENLALAALDNQVNAERDNADPLTMTQDKLEAKTAGMGAAHAQLDDPMYGLLFREEDEELLREAQRDFREDS